MSNLSWLLYCACSMLYINALLTNMCYQKLHFIEQLCIFLYSTVLYYVLASRYNFAIIPILIVSIYLYIIVKQKHPLINAIGMGVNYILGILINYLILAILYAMKLSIESISSNLGYMAIFCIIQTIIMYIATGTAGYFFRKLLVPHFNPHSPKKYSAKIICLLTAEILICCGVFLFNVIYGNYVGYNAATLIFNGVLFFILSLSSGLILFFLITTNAIYEQSGSLREIQSQVDHHFLLSHKSCLVNTSHIIEMDKIRRILILSNGLQIPVSVRQMHFFL